jgi:acyl-coenzyme A synthetase/AMP-(fatty) acid ligase
MGLTYSLVMLLAYVLRIILCIPSCFLDPLQQVKIGINYRIKTIHLMAHLGCVVAPLRLSGMLSSKELANDITTVVPKLLIVHQWEMQHTLTALGQSGIPEPPILLLNEPNEEIDEAYANMPTVDALFFSNEAAQPYQYTNEELVNSPCCLYFTSGSTGRSKAVMITQNAIVSQLLYIAGAVRRQCNNLVFTNFSFASSFGLYLIFGICSGMTSYILGKNESTLEGLCDAIERLKIKAVALPQVLSIFWSRVVK